MSSLFNGGISVSIFGESHGRGIGVVLDNLPAGEPLDFEEIGKFMARTRTVELLSGAVA